MHAGFFKKQEVIFQEPVFANSVSMMRQWLQIISRLPKKFCLFVVARIFSRQFWKRNRAQLERVKTWNGQNLEGRNLEGRNLEGAKLQPRKIWRGKTWTGQNMMVQNLNGQNLRRAKSKEQNLSDKRIGGL